MQRALNFRQLEAFRAVMLSGSMTGAGGLLRVSQPAVTRLIRDLEAELELKLFHRHGSRVIPSEEGRRLYREVERHFTGSDRIREAARAIRELDSSHLHVGAMLTLSVGCLPKAVARLLESHGDISVSVHSDSSLNIVDMISHGQLDLGLATVPADRRDIDHEVFAPVDAVCVIPAGHRLAKRKVVDVRDLDGERFVALGSSSLLRLQVEGALQAAGVRPQVRLGTLYSSTVAGYVGAGLGIAVTDPFAVLGLGASNIVVRPFRPRISFQFSAIYPDGHARSRVAMEFVAILRQVVSRELKRL